MARGLGSSDELAVRNTTADLAGIILVVASVMPPIRPNIDGILLNILASYPP